MSDTKNTSQATPEETQIALSYLSNLFSHFDFKNVGDNSPNPQAQTDKYFDTLTLKGDEWINFTGDSSAKVGENIYRVINMSHKNLYTDSPDYLDNAGHVISNNLKLYIADIGEGNIVFSYSPITSS